MPELRTISASGGVRLASQGFGPPDGRGVVLIMGATASMLGWPDALCENLASGGLRVVRFDQRDTGLSTTAPPGPPAYCVEDLADDVFAVMDGWGMERADLVGMSLGAYVAQVAALIRPDCVRSLTLIAGEPLGWEGEALPGIDPSFMEHFGRLIGRTGPQLLWRCWRVHVLPPDRPSTRLRSDGRSKPHLTVPKARPAPSTMEC
jgi:pimeloyl-ACP methyl ester carboxylesterase